MRQTDRPESFAPLGGPIKPATTTTQPKPAPPVAVNSKAGVYAGTDGKFFTAPK